MTGDWLDEILASTRREGFDRIVAGAVIIRDGRALILRRKADDYMGGMFEIPSGRLDGDETLAEALSREVEEETGLRVASIDRYLGSFDYSSRSGRKTRQLNLLIQVHASDVTLSEHDAFEWVREDEIGDYGASDKTSAIIAEAMREHAAEH